MMAGGEQDRLMSDINVTPFVDVMLVLLIIFMVTAPMMVHGVDVALPETSSSPVMVDEEERLIISVDRQQQIFINDMQVEFAFLNEKLAAIMENRRDRQVFLKGDRENSYGYMMAVMAEIKAAGVEKLGMLTQPLEEEKRR
ncbi:protein TolR [Desulfosudis oleivorans]|uniref:Biopolymer transport TolR n=1 Tax=Desulfosudis oleivorans (strain DSM 6200 / JCM 39069 / Hxd3) TaxID=96561 RepID=A8ZUI4_DESOH|nr:protein TolR [Desulfosudis oleivorans]ABW68016.1 Biopolymer transport TolR [Desulfosudis oleivorans Hxd3]